MSIDVVACDENASRRDLPREGEHGGNGHLAPHSGNCHCEQACAKMTSILGSISVGLSELAVKMEKQGEELAVVRSEMQQIATNEQVLSALHEDNRRYAEQFHEREVLEPLFLGLIDMADRCRAEVARLCRVAVVMTENGDVTAITIVNSLVEARKSDLTEIESLLARHSVESYEAPGERLDCKCQCSAARRSTHEAAQHGRIARRIKPGYRRHGRIIRSEHVDVYVFQS